MKKIVLVVGLIAGVVSDGHAFRTESYDRGIQGKYMAYCFNRMEAVKIQDAVNAGTGLSAAIALIPGAAPVAGAVAGALGGLSAILWWNTHKGTGFAVHVPAPGGIGVGRVPFLWDWDEGKKVY